MGCRGGAGGRWAVVDDPRRSKGSSVGSRIPAPMETAIWGCAGGRERHPHDQRIVPVGIVPLSAANLDETATGVSGCSTDSSVHLMRSIEEKFKVHLFERQNLAFVVKEKIQLLPLSQLAYEVENNFINSNTLYFNNTVLTKKEKSYERQNS